MANEISLSAGLGITKNGLNVSASASKSITLAGDQYMSAVQAIGTSTEAIAIGDVSTIGYLYVKNLDATNFIEISDTNPVGAEAQIKLLAGEFAVLPTRITAWYAKADTSPCNLQVVATEL